MQAQRQLVLILAAVLFPACLSAQAVDEEARAAFVAKETLGELKLGMTEKAVKAVLGEPESRGKEEEWAATGDHVQKWVFAGRGIELQMASMKKGGAKSVLMITAKAPSKLVTRKGAGIGSTEAEIIKAYGAYEDKENSKRGTTFVVGSIYGGIIFTFEKGKVSEIFFGAAAE